METIVLWGIGIVTAILILIWLKRRIFALVFFLIFMGFGPQLLQSAENFLTSIEPNSVIEWFKSFAAWIG